MLNFDWQILQDVPPNLVVDSEGQLAIGRFLGKGAFGAVFAGTLLSRSGKKVDVAVKMLQPTDPGNTATESDRQLYEVISSTIHIFSATNQLNKNFFFN